MEMRAGQCKRIIDLFESIKDLKIRRSDKSVNDWKRGELKLELLTNSDWNHKIKKVYRNRKSNQIRSVTENFIESGRGHYK
jgi:hypothetical protein